MIAWQKKFTDIYDINASYTHMVHTG